MADGVYSNNLLKHTCKSWCSKQSQLTHCTETWSNKQATEVQVTVLGACALEFNILTYSHFFYHGTTAPSGSGPPHYRGFKITPQTHHTRHDSSGRVISPTQRPLPDNTQHVKQANTHVPGGIRTHNPSKTATTNPHIRSGGHWDRHILSYMGFIFPTICPHIFFF